MVGIGRLPSESRLFTILRIAPASADLVAQMTRSS
jgi:hypothetical protein